MTVGVTQLDQSTPTVVAAQALGYLQANTVFAQLVARGDWDDKVAQCGDTVKTRLPGALTANDKAGGTAEMFQSPADTGVTVTLDKHKEVSFTIEDIARLDVPNGYIEDAVKGIAEAIDSDIAGLYSGLTQSGDATAGLGEDDFRNARRKLNAAKAPNADRSFVLSASAEYELLGIDKFINRDLDGAFVGRFMGFDCYMSQNVTFSTDWKNIAFHKNAFVLVSRPLPRAPDGSGVAESVLSEGGMSLRVTMSDSADHLGVKTTIDCLYGVKELRDNHGVVVTTAAVD